MRLLTKSKSTWSRIQSLSEVTFSVNLFLSKQFWHGCQNFRESSNDFMFIISDFKNLKNYQKLSIV